MRITTKQEHLDVVCTDTDWSEGYKIMMKLFTTCALGKYKGNAIGLAHNQIGGNKRVYVVKGSANSTWRGFINATIVEKSPVTFLNRENCMSYPKGKSAQVERHPWIVVNYLKGEKYVDERFEGMDAIIHQHEIDHINGIDIYKKEEQLNAK